MVGVAKLFARFGRIALVCIMDNAHLERLRREEVGLIRERFKPGMQVLELGGGNGFQAQILASWGCEVTSIDLPAAAAAPFYYPVQAYDGQHIPFPDHSFDAVFSSNVLEHIPGLSAILSEIARVVKADGVIVHILPSTTWRFWTSLAHYLHLVRRVVSLALPAVAGQESAPSDDHAPTQTWWTLVKRIFLDGPHGAYASEFHELYAFSRTRWLRLFRDQGFDVVMCFPSGLFYTGYAILPGWTLDGRRLAAHLLGSSAHVYVLRPRMVE